MSDMVNPARTLSVGSQVRELPIKPGCPAEWPDRRIMSSCGLSAKAVARLRREQRDWGGVVVGLDRRPDGHRKVRQGRPDAIRERIRRALAENPQASLRMIGAMVGESPETVRAVRAALVPVGPLDGSAA
jgi:hypothetical protein